MQTVASTPNQGLSGKARRNHRRKRALKRHARAAIEEYFVGDGEGDGETLQRYIPIRGRSEFLPTLAQSDERATYGLNSQLELPLGANGDRGATRKVGATTTPSVVAQKTDKQDDIPICFPRKASLRAAPMFKPPVHFRGRPRFTIGGFMWGCTMGSAAAAVVLLILRVVVG